MSSNGTIVDEGLTAINVVFRDAFYQNDDAKECAELMMAGAHRSLELADSVVMELYAGVVEGKKFVVTHVNNKGRGYLVRIEDFAELAEFLRGELGAYTVDSGRELP